MLHSVNYLRSRPNCRCWYKDVVGNEAVPFEYHNVLHTYGCTSGHLDIRKINPDARSLKEIYLFQRYVSKDKKWWDAP